MKKPCEPVEKAGRDYTTVFCETDPLCAALDELCSALNFWYGSMNNPWQREDRAYRKMLAKQTQAALKDLPKNYILLPFLISPFLKKI